MTTRSAAADPERGCQDGQGDGDAQRHGDAPRRRRAQGPRRHHSVAESSAPPKKKAARARSEEARRLPTATAWHSDGEIACRSMPTKVSTRRTAHQGHDHRRGSARRPCADARDRHLPDRARGGRGGLDDFRRLHACVGGRRNLEFNLPVRIPALEKAMATRQLATLVNAGVPLVEALTALVEQTEHRALKAVFARVRERVNEGSTLADALISTGRFDNLFVSMVRAARPRAPSTPCSSGSRIIPRTRSGSTTG